MEFLSDEAVRNSAEFLELQKEMEGITPIRHEWIRKYLNKYKNQPKRIKVILEMAEESEAYTKLFMPDEKYVHFLDAMPDLKEYTANVLKQEEERLALKKLQEEEAKEKADTSNVFVLQSAIKEKQNANDETIPEAFNMRDFNPFDAELQKRQQKMINEAFILKQTSGGGDVEKGLREDEIEDEGNSEEEGEYKAEEGDDKISEEDLMEKKSRKNKKKK